MFCYIWPCNRKRLDLKSSWYCGGSPDFHGRPVFSVLTKWVSWLQKKKKSSTAQRDPTIKLWYLVYRAFFSLNKGWNHSNGLFLTWWMLVCPVLPQISTVDTFLVWLDTSFLLMRGINSKISISFNMNIYPVNIPFRLNLLQWKKRGMAERGGGRGVGQIVEIQAAWEL